MSAKDIVKRVIEGRPVGKPGSKTLSGDVTPGGLGSLGKKAAKEVVEAFSHRGSELSKVERAAIRTQNKAADSMKSKDLDRVESGKKGAETKRFNDEASKKALIKKVAGAAGAAGAAAGAAAEYVVAKGTQKDHHTTTSKNFTKKSK